MDVDPQIASELSIIFKNVQKILDLRHKYIRTSLQGTSDNPKDDPAWNIYPPPPEPAWTEEHEKAANGGRVFDRGVGDGLVDGVSLSEGGQAVRSAK